MNAWIRIEYDEGHEDPQSTYEGVSVTVGKTKSKVFNTGDPVADWKAAHLWMAGRTNIHTIMLYSSCDHFTMDGDTYKWLEREGVDILVGNA
jgi:hypothetical protein